MSDIRAMPHRPDSVVAAPRRGAHAAVRDFIQGSGCPASVYEVADRVGIQVCYRLRVLRATGRLRKGARRRFAAWDPRIGYHPALYVEAADVPSEVHLPSPIGAVVLVPVYGWIPGSPLNETGDPDDDPAVESAFLLDKRPIGDGTLFMLKVLGDSMINAGIADGNWVVVRQQKDAKDGDIVAAMVDREVTVKTLRREPGHLELMPQNPDFEPIPVTELTILGKVVGVVRQA